MTKKIVITNVPTRLPFQSTLLYFFLLHYFEVGQIWWGVFITLYSIIWISRLFSFFNEIRVDLYKEEKDKEKEKEKRKFVQKLGKLIIEQKQ